MRPAQRRALGESYLHALTAGGEMAAAAAAAPQLLEGQAAAWERWVYTFAQMRALPVLAPHIPTGRWAEVVGVWAGEWVGVWAGGRVGGWPDARVGADKNQPRTCPLPCTSLSMQTLPG